MQLGKCKAERVGAVQDVGAVLVVIGYARSGCRSRAAARPSQACARGAPVALSPWRNWRRSAQATRPTRWAWTASTSNLAASRCTVVERMSVSLCSRSSMSNSSAVSQGALGRLHLVDLEDFERGTQHTDATADDGAPVVLQTVHAHLVRAARRHQLLAQPVEALAGDGAGWPAGGAQYVTHGTDGSRGAVGHVPGIRGDRSPAPLPARLARRPRPLRTRHR